VVRTPRLGGFDSGVFEKGGERLSYQFIVAQVKSDDPVDKLLVLNAEFKEHNFYGKVVLIYEAGRITRVLPEENVKF
jgi:hypothetical protein